MRKYKLTVQVPIDAEDLFTNLDRDQVRDLILSLEERVCELDLTYEIRDAMQAIIDKEEKNDS